MVNNIIKRIVDILISSVAILLLSPVFLIISMLIKRESEGDILFKQGRVGLNNRIFYIYKFRSMYKNDTVGSPSPKDDKDPRVTKVGRILRKTSLDELPQLFNVLKGDMTLIGPRAITKSAIEKRVEEYVKQKPGDYSHAKMMYEVRQHVKPGITGLTQVNGRSNAGVVNATEYDYQYAKHQSLLLDIKIFIKTFVILINKKGTN